MLTPRNDETSCNHQTSDEWRMRGSNPRPPACKADPVVNTLRRFSPLRRGFVNARIFASIAIAAAVCAVSTSPATAKPCAKHPVKTDSAKSKTVTRSACLKQYKRNKQKFPAAPIAWWEVKRRVPDYQTFLRIGRCEQPGSGEHGIKWTVTGPTYEGGLGFWHGTWDGWRPKHYPGNAGWATPQQQVLVADAVRDSVGISAWGCA